MHEVFDYHKMMQQNQSEIFCFYQHCSYLRLNPFGSWSKQGINVPTRNLMQSVKF